MTSRLATLRARLASLRRARASVRALAAWSALAIAALAALAAMLVLDLIFELAVPQRVVVLLLAAGAIGWAFWRFTRPLLPVSEGDIEMALLVERQQRIDSDLVAALQFEQPEAAGWGSGQLAAAVVEYVAAVGGGINVFEGFAWQRVVRRLSLLVGSLLIALAATLVWPGHLTAFLNRLVLGSMHYPTRTRIEQVLINRTPVLLRNQHGSAPADGKSAQGRPVTFLVQCMGELPPHATIHLAAAGPARTRTQLDLKPLSQDERLARLNAAVTRLNDASQTAAGAISPPWRDELLALVRFDAPQAIAPLLAAKTRDDLPAVVAAVTKATENWPGDHGRSALLAGQLGRLNESLTYKLLAGDAWTDPARIAMIPLPIVELRVTPLPPKYAQVAAERPDPAGRQLAVLEGSSVELAVECANRKRLQSAWLTVQGSSGTRRLDLAPQDADGFVWTPQADTSPLHNIREELRYEVQVIDNDGLSLETPIRGTIRIRPDRPPTGLAEVVHKVVLPSAEPVVEYRAGDDYGLSRLALVVEVERRAAAAPPGSLHSSSAASDSGSEGGLTPAAAIPAETHRYEILAAGLPLTSDRLPLLDKYALSLSPLKLVKGDRVKLTLEVTDYRGENEHGQPAGVAYLSDPLVLEISDESGVLAAISEADPRSDERLTDIIKRQLGIGESP